MEKKYEKFEIKGIQMVVEISNYIPDGYKYIGNQRGYGLYQKEQNGYRQYLAADYIV